MYLFLGLYEGLASYEERSRKPQKRTSSASNLNNYLHFFVGRFCLPGSGSGSRDPIKSGSETQFLIVTVRCFTFFEGYPTCAINGDSKDSFKRKDDISDHCRQYPKPAKNYF
jgi:hypothetical protein